MLYTPGLATRHLSRVFRSLVVMHLSHSTASLSRPTARGHLDRIQRDQTERARPDRTEHTVQGGTFHRLPDADTTRWLSRTSLPHNNSLNLTRTQNKTAALGDHHTRQRWKLPYDASQSSISTHTRTIQSIHFVHVHFFFFFFRNLRP